MSHPAPTPMSPERWRAVKAALADALACEPGDRVACLDRACGADAELRREVESLLASSDAAGDFLARPAVEQFVEAGAALGADAELTARLAAALHDRYAIERRLDGGGMSHVFLASERALGRQVVVKVLAPGIAASLSVGRFRREIAVAARLQHPNIIPLLSAGEADGLPFYTMPFVEGQSLRARLQRAPPMAVREVVTVLRDATRALAYAHDHGVVHRDVKPDNILMADGAAVVTDFGIAKAIAVARSDGERSVRDGARDHPTTLTQTGMVLGTLAYMAPEQAAGDDALDHRADIYALGCTAYELLTGRTPFAARLPHLLIAAHHTERPAPVAALRGDVPPALNAIVMRCLEKDPAARPTTAEIVQALDAVRADAAAPRRRGRVAVLLGALALAVATPLVVPMVERGRERLAAGELAGRTVAVLPLRDASGDTANAYFAAGLADELTHALARVEGLRVTPASAAGVGDASGTRELARRLRVATLLDGSVQRAGERLRVRVRLVDGAGGHVLWAHEYDVTMSDVLAVPADIADSVAASLRVTLRGDAQARVARAPGTRDGEAYLLYLQGRHAAARYTEAELRRALALYDDAIARDTTFARAWAGAADAWASLAGDYLAPGEALPQARAAARRAVALDPSLADAHVALGNVLLADWDAAGAAAAFGRAVELEPASAAAHYYAASALLPLRRHAEALERARTAQRLDPAQAAYAAAVALVLLHAGHADSAAAAARQAYALDSSFTHALTVLGDALRLQGRPREALDAYAGRGPARTAYDLVGPALARIALGQRDEARRAMRELGALGTRQSAPDDALAMIHAHLGARDSAFAALERAYAARSAGLVSLASAPDWAPLRDDPRFADLVRRVARR